MLIRTFTVVRFIFWRPSEWYCSMPCCHCATDTPGSAAKLGIRNTKLCDVVVHKLHRLVMLRTTEGFLRNGTVCAIVVGRSVGCTDTLFLYLSLPAAGARDLPSNARVEGLKSHGHGNAPVVVLVACVEFGPRSDR